MIRIKNDQLKRTPFLWQDPLIFKDQNSVLDDEVGKFNVEEYEERIDFKEPG